VRGTCITPERLIECRMGEIVNLRRARKKAERQLAERTASANRLRHGRSQAERELETKRDAKARRDLDRHRIERGAERGNLRASSAPSSSLATRPASASRMRSGGGSRRSPAGVT